MSARRYTLTVRADDYTLMSALHELAELIPGSETNWFVATDEALARARRADQDALPTIDDIQGIGLVGDD